MKIFQLFFAILLPGELVTNLQQKELTWPSSKFEKKEGNLKSTILISDFGFSGRLSSSQDFKFALANLQKNFEKLAAKTDTNKLDDFLKLEVCKVEISVF